MLWRALTKPNIPKQSRMRSPFQKVIIAPENRHLAKRAEAERLAALAVPRKGFTVYAGSGAAGLGHMSSPFRYGERFPDRSVLGGRPGVGTNMWRLICWRCISPMPRQ